MNVTNKTTRTFDILDITEDQAQHLLTFATSAVIENVLDDDEKETFNCLRQALLAAGLTKKGD